MDFQVARPLLRALPVATAAGLAEATRLQRLSAAWCEAGGLASLRPSVGELGAENVRLQAQVRQLEAMLEKEAPIPYYPMPRQHAAGDTSHAPSPPRRRAKLATLVKKSNARMVVVSALEWGLSPGHTGSPWGHHLMPVVENLVDALSPSLVVSYDFEISFRDRLIAK